MSSPPPSPGHPDDYTQLEKRSAEFCDTVDIGQVVKLVSRYADGQKILVSSVVEHGCGFTCQKVVFPKDGRQWVIRIPITTALRNEWDIVKNEVATIRYIKRHTSINVPTVHAYGKGERLTSDPSRTQSFIITDRVAGIPLSDEHLLFMTKEQRGRLFSQVGDVLAELQKLKFDSTGSLYVSEADDEKEYIGASLCHYNIIQGKRDGVVRSRPTVTTTYDSIQQHLETLRGEHNIRAIGEHMDQKERIELEVFATDAVTRHATDKSHAFWREPDAFMLDHGSLTINQIFVDNEGNIQGIVNWSKSEILPRQLCQPPAWITRVGRSPEEKNYICIWDEFQRAIPPHHAYHEHLQYYLEHEKHIGFASILRNPPHLVQTYFQGMYYVQHPEVPYWQLLDEFFNTRKRRGDCQNEHRAERDRRIADRKLHSDDIIVRRALALAPHLDQMVRGIQELISIAKKPKPDDSIIRCAFALAPKLDQRLPEVQELISIVKKSQSYLGDPLPPPPLFAAGSGNSPVPSQSEGGSDDIDHTGKDARTDEWVKSITNIRRARP